jgi:hypothetical protein
MQAFFCCFFSFVFWVRISLCWPGSWDLPAFVSWVLGLRHLPPCPLLLFTVHHIFLFCNNLLLLQYYSFILVQTLIATSNTLVIQKLLG